MHAQPLSSAQETGVAAPLVLRLLNGFPLQI